MSLDGLPKSVKSLITKDYGDKYLDDADYIAFFWGQIDKKSIDKLFNVVDKALGKSANKLTDKDFKKIHMKNEDSTDDEDAEADDDDKEDIEVDDEETEVVDDNDEDSDESTEELNEDEDEEIENAVEVEVEEKPEVPTAYFFLKITQK